MAGILAESAGKAGRRGMQWLLNFYAGTPDGVRDDAEATVVALGDAQRAVLIIDETGFC